MPIQILVSNLGEVPKAEGALDRANGRTRLSYCRTLSYTCKSHGEVDFAVYPAISHGPMAL